MINLKNKFKNQLGLEPNFGICVLYNHKPVHIVFVEKMPDQNEINDYLVEIFTDKEFDLINKFSKNINDYKYLAESFEELNNLNLLPDL